VKASFTGDIAKLDKWAKRLREVPKAMDELSVQLAEETVHLIRDGFEKSRDPYGKKWADLKLRDGRPLEDRGQLKGSWFRKYSDRKGFLIASADNKKAVWHQYGTGIYGPHKERIKPKNAKAFALPVKGKMARVFGGVMFASSTKGTVARPMLPYKKHLPKRWVRAYQEVAEDFLTEHFR
jgi:phage gpG-like protein